MAKTKTDKYANIAAISVNESSAGTLATSKFAFPFSIMDKMALLISRIEYYFSGVQDLNSNGDYIHGGLLAGIPSSGLLLYQNDPVVIDTCSVQRIDAGTAASGMLLEKPFAKDFSQLPGGGILVAPNPLYAGIITSGSGGVGGLWIKLFYTYMELDTDEYWQLVESRRIISS